MSQNDKKKVNPSQQPELDDAALESVSGGCEVGSSIQSTAVVYPTPIVPVTPIPEPIIPINPGVIVE